MGFCFFRFPLLLNSKHKYMKNTKLFLLTILILPLMVFGQDEARVHIINVGQGSATLLEFPCGVMLIDTGGEENTEFKSTEILMNYLDEFFQRRTDLHATIDMLIISHPHKDHTAGIKSVVNKYTIKNVISNGQEYGSGRYPQIFLHETISNTEATPDPSDDIFYTESVNSKISPTGLLVPVFNSGSCNGINTTIKLLWGRIPTNPGWTEAKYSNNNNHSVVARVDYGEASILFTGDLEEEAIQKLVQKFQGTAMLDSDIYLVGHHGSKNGSTLDMVRAITPEIAVLSFGDPDRQEAWTAWQYGHPNKNIITMLQQNCSQSRTAKEVPVGTKSKTFTKMTITKAVYGTGWDDHIILQATPSGTWRYLSELDHDIKININTADIASLQNLPSIGPTRAQAIVDYRTAHGNFTSVEDLDAVPGIGPATITLIRSRVQI